MRKIFCYIILLFLFACNNKVYKEKNITFKNNCNNKQVEIFSNDSLIFKDKILINASIGEFSLKIYNICPSIKIRINNYNVFHKNINKFKNELIITNYDSLNNTINYDIVTDSFKPGEGGID